MTQKKITFVTPPREKKRNGDKVCTVNVQWEQTFKAKAKRLVDQKNECIHAQSGHVSMEGFL